jgi:enterochelin esterase-like enzyme
MLLLKSGASYMVLRGPRWLALFAWTVVFSPLALAQMNAPPSATDNCIPAGSMAAWRSGVAPLVSPAVASNGMVTLRLCAPGAGSVRVLGDWNTASPGGDLLTKDARGVWSIAVGPLKPEYYLYWFTVDGVKTIDPDNVHSANDAVRMASYFIVPGQDAESSLYENRMVPHGDMTALWYSSASIESPRRALVYTPPQYRESGDRYPVLYLLHGWGGDENEWPDLGRLAQIMDNLLAEKKIVPMIVVMPNGHPDRHSIPDITPPDTTAVLGPLPPKGYDSTHNVEQIDQSITGDLVPFIDHNFRTIPQSASRAIFGLSMGGGQASYTGLRHPDTFAWVGTFSGAIIMWPGAMAPAKAPAGAANSTAPAIPRYSLNLDALGHDAPDLNESINGKLRLLYISCGLDDGLITSNKEFEAWLTERNIRFTSRQVPGYAHVWSFWRKSLVDVAPTLFR